MKERIDFLSFFLYNGLELILKMNKEKVKLIVKNMELLVQSLKLELEEPDKENIVSLDDIIKTYPSYYPMDEEGELEYYDENEIDVQ